MLIKITVSADVGVNARYAAENQARAQGFSKVQVFSVIPVGHRLYEVQLNVSK